MSENIRQKNKAWSPFFVYGLSRDHDLNINDVHKAFNTGFDEGYNYAVNHQKHDNNKKYIYFVSFSYHGGNGNCVKELNIKMNLTQIREIEMYINKDQKVEDTVINNFILLDR